MNAVTVKNLSKRYRDNPAVDGISFDVAPGEFFAFLGENGAGKSTTINIISTILEKSGGEVYVFGHELGKDDDVIRTNIGIVFQNSVLDNKLTVKENLYTRASYYGFSRRETKERIEGFRESFELGPIWNQNYEKLSGGQKRRIDIARALIHRPKILILDEPTTGLDPNTRSLVWNHIETLRKTEELTIFLTTHYMEETAEADHVVILDRGKVIADGTPAQLKCSHAKSRLIWHAPQTEENSALLEGYEYSYQADHYNLFFQGNITEFLYANRSRVTDYEVVKGTMDDVFLNLTKNPMKHVENMTKNIRRI